MMIFSARFVELSCTRAQLCTLLLVCCWKKGSWGKRKQ